MGWLTELKALLITFYDEVTYVVNVTLSGTYN